MDEPSGSASARFLQRFSLACFVALLVTIATVSVFPLRHRLAYAIVEWAEMVVGTVSAVIAFVVTFRLPRVDSTDGPRWGRQNWFAICGLGIWCIFWLVALLVRPWTD